ncbi:SigE family RNA polymerase sigma factor [Phytohabitans flavus]|uniref:RNA polymerase sigma24 factor n=1 Tax=Phytohabitans flavus TaxID=1076124 RepID=A0A6F8XJ03_9ACTN|nr:SigE family RNA polymerase sigma factor [Phytohabitans flavus]BCB73771.1 RNA polymerase sigma24 factor [Phytohabitans flavus]
MRGVRWRGSGRRQRDEEFTAFVAATAPRLRRTAYLMCGDWHLAQDLTQTALARIYASWARVQRSDNLDAYTRRVLMNAIFDQRKRRSSGEVVLAELPEPVANHPEAAAELHVTLMGVLATLPVRDQAIVVLRYWEDHSVETVADILGVSASVVKTQSARALTRLRAALGEEFART